MIAPADWSITTLSLTYDGILGRDGGIKTSDPGGETLHALHS